VRYFVTVGDRHLEVDLTGATPLVDGVPVRVEMLATGSPGVRHLLVDGESIVLAAQPAERRGRWNLSLGSRRLVVDVVDERTRAIRAMTGDEVESEEKSLLAPMPGMVLKVEVVVGQAVKAGQGVVIVEAMKMENELKAPADGVVAQIAVVAGQTVEKGAILLTLE
jgi:biotin carboxyl carrier protein